MTSRSKHFIDPRAIYAYLAVNARGRKAAIKAPVIAREIGAADEYRETASAGNGAGAYFRRAISQAVTQGYPICACRQGYYVPETCEELLAGLNNLRSRAEAILKRAARLEDNVAKFYGRATDAHP